MYPPPAGWTNVAGQTPHPPKFFQSTASVYKKEIYAISTTKTQRIHQNKFSSYTSTPESNLKHETHDRPSASIVSSAKKYLGTRSSQLLETLRLARKFACKHGPQ